jgi:hypothetical protein
MDLVREIHLREAEGHSASSYAEGQMLSHPVKVIAAYRE